MTHLLIDVILLGVVWQFAAMLFKRTRIVAPSTQATQKPARPAVKAVGTRSIGRIDAEHPQVATGQMIGPSYLLGTENAGKSADGTRAMLEMMSGPGVCTPRER